MRSHPSTGWFVAATCLVLLAAGWPRVDESVRASREDHPWRPGPAGLTLRVPEGWSEARPGGALCLMRDPAQALQGSCAISVEPDFSVGPDGWWLDDWVESFAALREVESCVRMQIDCVPAVRVDWRGQPLGSERSMRGVVVVCDRGAARVRLEWSAGESEWLLVESEVEEMVGSLAFED